MLLSAPAEHLSREGIQAPAGELADSGTPPGDERRLRAEVLARASGVFADAIERHAAEAADRRGYYRLVLAALAGEAPIDLVALAAASAGAAKGQPAEPSAPEAGRGQPAASASPEAPGADDRPGELDALARALAGDGADLDALALPILIDPFGVAQLADAWPDGQLARLFSRLRGDPFERLRPYAETLTRACRGAAPPLLRRLHWQFLAGALFPALRFAEAAPFVVAYADFLAAVLSAPGGGLPGALAAAAEGPQARHVRFWLRGRGPQRAAAPADALAAGGFGIGNAGQVLAAAYLPRLFEVLGLVVEGRFVTEEAALRASHLLQFLVDGRADAAEHELPLNKLLCGLDLRQPVPAGIDITDQERQTIENMLRAIIAHWGALGSTSVAGLREAFLQRPGLLRQQGDAWQLKVEKKTLDILLEKLPWGFSVIRHPWMPQALMVDWC